jgi:hypothetical protein
VSYRIFAVERDQQWIARAEREDTGRPFGIELAGPTESAAILRLTRWLEWQREHTEALAALQAAERLYHRAAAGAFANQADDAAVHAGKRESLDALDAARVTLDAIRLRKPEKSA